MPWLIPGQREPEWDAPVSFIDPDSAIRGEEWTQATWPFELLTGGEIGRRRVAWAPATYPTAQPVVPKGNVY